MNLNEFLDKFSPPGKLIFAKVWGSRSHNTQKEDSDTDFSGVYLFRTSDVLSVRCPDEAGIIETYKHDTESVPNVSKDEHPDYQFHEIGRFSELLLKGNPGIIEMLFTERMCIQTPEWEELAHEKHRFLSQQAVHQYLGYMTGQMKRLIAHGGQKGLHTKGGAYNEKWAYHLLRLAGDAKNIAQGGFPVVWKDGEERDFLMRIRHEEFTWKEVEAMANKAISDIEDCRPFPIREQGDKAFLNDWLLRVRKLYW